MALARRVTGAVPLRLEPGEDHWHGAAPDRFMTHLAMQEVDSVEPHVSVTLPPTFTVVGLAVKVLTMAMPGVTVRLVVAEVLPAGPVQVSV